MLLGHKGQLVRDGADGRDGVDGRDGADGKDGVDGKDGAPGADGRDGTNGINGINGIDGKDGVDGENGLPGEKGDKGDAYIGNLETGNLVVGDGLGRLAEPGDPIASFNTSVGVRALFKNTEGYDNVAVGFRALHENTTGFANVGIGLYALNYNSTGVNNVAVGRDALGTNLTGSDNIALGGGALFRLEEGRFNTAVGVNAAPNTTSGFFNTAVGHQALQNNQTGMGITVLGQDSDVGSPDLENATAIGFRTTVMSSNTIQLGNDGVQKVSTFAPIQVGDVTYPNRDGSEGQILVTNGQGDLYWATPATLGADGSSCSVNQTTSGATLSCTDGTLASIANGINGANGRHGIDGINGVNGVNGQDGADGQNGADGSSCSVEEIDGGAVVSCTDGTSAVLANSGTVILVPEGVTGEAETFSYNTGDIVVVDDNGEVLARTIPSDTQQIQGFKVDLGFIQNVFWPRAVLYNDAASSTVKLTSYDDGAPPQLWYLTSDCSGPVWLSYDFGVYDGDYFISDPSFPLETLLFGSRRFSDRYTSYDAVLSASECEQVQFSGTARRGLVYSPATEIINAAFPARLEQLP